MTSLPSLNAAISCCVDGSAWQCALVLFEMVDSRLFVSVVLHEDQICSLLHMHLMFRQVILIWVSVSLNHQLKIAGSHLVNLITNMSVDLVEPRPTV